MIVLIGDIPNLKERGQPVVPYRDLDLTEQDTQTVNDINASFPVICRH